MHHVKCSIKCNVCPKHGNTKKKMVKSIYKIKKMCVKYLKVRPDYVRF